jgi:hypothetical protein
MGTKQYDSATDLLTFSRASGGTALSKISYSNDELVTNGTFDTDATGWVGNNLYYSPTIESQRLKVVTGASVQWNYAQTSVSGLTIGKTYRFQASSFVGTTTRHRISLGTSSGQSFDILSQGLGYNVNQTVDMTFTATTTVVYVSLQNTDGVNGSTTFFDNISIKEVLFDQADGTLQVFNHGNNLPRIEYDATGAVKGLLIEEARTNILRHSSDYTGVDWTKNGTTVTASAGVSPSGLTDASLITASAITDEHRIYQNRYNLGTYNTFYTKSIYAKSGTANYISVGGGTVTAGYAVFNLSTGVVSSQANIQQANIEDVGGGWYRCSIHGTVASTFLVVNIGTTAANAVPQVNWLGAGETVQVYGSQWEAGAFPTSYIPTTGATATRARDVAEIPTSAFGYNNDKGSLVVDVLTPFADQLMALAIFNTSSYHHSRSLWKSNYALNGAGDYFKAQAHDTVAAQTTNQALTQQTQAGYTKLGLSYGDSEKAVRDGGTVISGDSRSPTPTRLHLGGRDNGYQSQCWIKSIQYYPRQLTDTQLQELTT